MLHDILDKLTNKMRGTPPLGYLVALDFGDEGKIFLDGRNGENALSQEGGDPDTILTLNPQTMQDILDGKTDPNMAVLLGKLKISGRLGVAMKMASYLED